MDGGSMATDPDIFRKLMTSFCDGLSERNKYFGAVFHSNSSPWPFH
jgi:hypothetical protein